METLPVSRRITRRAFGAVAVSPLLATTKVWGQGRDAVSVEVRGFSLEFPGGGKPWRVMADDVKIGGLTIPKFTTNWVGLQLVSGLLSGAGGFIFQALLSALGLGGPSIEELLRKQLIEIEKIVTAAIKANEIRRCIAHMEAIRQNMVEYMNAPAGMDRLQQATGESQTLVSELKSFGFETYSLTMCAASLRLAVLYERAKLDKKEKKNYAAFADAMKDYHAKTDKAIDATTPTSIILKGVPDNLVTSNLVAMITLMGRVHRHYLDKPVLGKPVKSLPRHPKDSKAFNDHVMVLYEARVKQQLKQQLPKQLYDPKVRQFPAMYHAIRSEATDQVEKPGDKVVVALVNWDELRKRLRDETTTPGAKIINGWTESTKLLEKV